MRVANGVTDSDSIVILDERANDQHREIEEEWADWDSDTTALEEGEDDGESEWYDSDDKAFDHEDDEIFKPGPQSETSKETEPNAVWIASEAINAGAPW